MFSQPGEKPEDNVFFEAVTLANPSGQTSTYSFETWPSSGESGAPFINVLPNANMTVVNLKSQYRPFYIYEPGTRIIPYGGGTKEVFYEYSHFHAKNHWPTCLMPTDGRRAWAADRVTSSAITSPEPPMERRAEDGALVGRFIMGLTRKPAGQLTNLARSWLKPAALELTTRGFSGGGYNGDQCAYILNRVSEANMPLEFRLAASEESPVVNPAFVIKNWGDETAANLKVNGQPQSPGPNFRQGIVRDTDGSPSLVVWLNLESATAVDIELAATHTARSRASSSTVSDAGNTGVTARIDVTDIPEEHFPFKKAGFSKYVSVFGIHIFSTAKTPGAKILHVAKVMAEYLDNDEDGVPDNPLVLSHLVSRNAYLVFPADEDEFETMDPDIWHDAGYHAGQFQHSGETRPGFLVDGKIRAEDGGGYDASLEEVLHLITDHGYANAYPEIFGSERGTAIADCLDAARGGYFPRVPTDGPHYGYPEGSWFHYDDETCEYQCMIAEYFYWAPTSILRTQDYEGRAQNLRREWELNTPELVSTRDPDVYALLTTPQYKLPTKAPDGNYSPSASPTTIIPLIDVDDEDRF